MEYLIWSIEHQAWWKYRARGYSKNVADAGLYTLEEATRVCLDANRFRAEKPEQPPNEAIVPVSKSFV